MDTKFLIKNLSEKLNRSTEEIESALDAFSKIIIDSIGKNDIVGIPGFGQFESKIKAERIAIHPSTGKKILVPPRVSMIFKPSTLLKQKVK